MTVDELIIEIKTKRDVAKTDLDILRDGWHDSPKVLEVCNRLGHGRLMIMDVNTIENGIRALAEMCLKKYKQLETTLWWIEQCVRKSFDIICIDEINDIDIKDYNEEMLNRDKAIIYSTKMMSNPFYKIINEEEGDGS